MFLHPQQMPRTDPNQILPVVMIMQSILQQNSIVFESGILSEFVRKSY